MTDLPAGWIHYPSSAQSDIWHSRTNNERGLLLASYTWGEESLRWTSLNERDRLLYALKNLAEVHGEPLDAEVTGARMMSSPTLRVRRRGR